MLLGYRHGDRHKNTAKLRTYRTWDMTCIYMLSLKLSTNIKMNLIYLISKNLKVVIV